MLNEKELLDYLGSHNIAYRYVAHAPVYTCEQAEALRPDLPGVSTKNLFLRDEKKRFYLVMTACEKRLDLKALGRALNAPKLQFGDEERLLEMLGVTPGAVTVLGLINDTGLQVRLVVDEDVWAGEYFMCHPLVNNATLLLTHTDLQHFFELSGHTPWISPIPVR